MEARSSPLCLELCPCLSVSVPERDHSCACLTHTESSSAIPSDPRDFPSECRRPRFPSAGSTWQLHSNVLVVCVEMYTDLKQPQIISQLGQPQVGKQVVNVFPPTHTGTCALELCCLILFPIPIPSALGCAFPASAVRETGIL